MFRRGYFNHQETSYTILSSPLAALNGNTQGGGLLGPCPQGYCWYVERWTQHITTTAVFELAVISSDEILDVTVWDKTGRVDWAATSVNARADLAAPIYVGPGDYLLALWSGGNATEKGVATFQIAVHKLELENVPMARHEPQDETIIRDEHEQEMEGEAETETLAGVLTRTFDAAI